MPLNLISLRDQGLIQAYRQAHPFHFDLLHKWALMGATKEQIASVIQNDTDIKQEEQENILLVSRALLRILKERGLWDSMTEEEIKYYVLHDKPLPFDFPDKYELREVQEKLRG